MKTEILFTPGPLTTSTAVKQAMLRDLGSRDKTFTDIVHHIQTELLAIAEVPKNKYSTILMPGSGTNGVESVLSSITPPDGKWLVIVNGEYGRRIVKILQRHHIAVTVLESEENLQANLNDIEQTLSTDQDITHVAVVHCETTTGILNDINNIGKLAKKHHKTYFIDAMSSFGAVPVSESQFDYLVSSANKCLESVPGFSFIIANRENLKTCSEYARTFSLDLYQQMQNFEKTGQFRFTPPVQTLLAFDQALKELKEEGGIAKRAKRYQQNQKLLCEGMQQMNFKTYVDATLQSNIITSFYELTHPNFSFEKLYQLLSNKGFIIYPGKLSKAATFRIANIGKISKQDIQDLLAAIRNSLLEMGAT